MFPIKYCQNSVSTAKLESYDLCFLRPPDSLAPRDPEDGLVGEHHLALVLSSHQAVLIANLIINIFLKKLQNFIQNWAHLMADPVVDFPESQFVGGALPVGDLQEAWERHFALVNQPLHGTENKTKFINHIITTIIIFIFFRKQKKLKFEDVFLLKYSIFYPNTGLQNLPYQVSTF